MISESKSVKVLYMEDDIGLARLCQKRLNRLGYEVDLAYDGSEGLVMYDANLYDVVVIDNQMPVEEIVDGVLGLFATAMRNSRDTDSTR